MLVGGELWGSREEGWGEGDEDGGLDTAMNLRNLQANGGVVKGH